MRIKIFVVCTLFTGNAFAISDGSNFIFVNNTHQELKFQQLSSNWFNKVTTQIITPGTSFKFQLEGECFHPWAQEDAATTWIIAAKTQPEIKHTFDLTVINRAGFNCAKRLFSVNGQFRRIEFAPIGTGEKSTPTPYFRFTAVEYPENPAYFELLQEGPQRMQF